MTIEVADTKMELRSLAAGMKMTALEVVQTRNELHKRDTRGG